METDKKRKTEPVQVDIKVKARVEKYLAGKKQSLGRFYTQAALEKLKNENK